MRRSGRPPVCPTPPTPERPSPAELAKMRAESESRPPAVFPSVVVTGKVTAGTVDAACFNLIDEEERRLATLSTTDDGSPGLALFRPGPAARARRADP